MGHSKMRIIKLSKEQFPTLNDARRFFRQELKGRNPPGKFRVTPGRIARKNGLQPAEPLVFTYDAQIIFAARAKSGLQGQHR